jgi:hypothetical protein
MTSTKSNHDLFAVQSKYQPGPPLTIAQPSTGVFLRFALILAICSCAGCAWFGGHPGDNDSASAESANPPASAQASSPSSSNPSDSHLADNSQTPDSNSHKQANPDSAAQQASVDANLNRLFLERPAPEEFAGSAIAPGGERLLNDKAEHYSQFTRPLLQRLYDATIDIEHQGLARNGVPANLRPVIIQATMDGDGQLTELVIQQLSGSGAVDQAMIKACKKGLWVRNPPPEARMADGKYRFRIEATIKNFMRPTAYDDWMLRTHVGLALE